MELIWRMKFMQFFTRISTAKNSQESKFAARSKSAFKKAFRAAKESATFIYAHLAKSGHFTHPIFESDFVRSLR